MVVARLKSLGLVVILMVAVSVTGCLSRERGISAVDDAGRELILDRPPQRIVSMAPSNTEILFSLGLGDRVVGVTTFCNYPPETVNVEKVGDSYAPDYEKVVSLAPDLVLAVGTGDSQLVKGLEGYGLKVFVLQAGTVDRVASSIELVGEVTGTREKAHQVAAELRERLAAVEGRVGKVAESGRPKVFWALDDLLWTVGPGSFVDDLIARAGGRNVGDRLGRDYGQFSLEGLLEADPDVIIVPVLDPSVPRALERLNGWATLSAVRNGRVYQIDPDIVSRPGPRMAEALEEVAAILYPELFGE